MNATIIGLLTKRQLPLAEPSFAQMRRQNCSRWLNRPVRSGVTAAA